MVGTVIYQRSDRVSVLMEISLVGKADSEKLTMQVIHNCSCGKCNEKNARRYESLLERDLMSGWGWWWSGKTS